jgi:hypothetical protein
LFIKFIDSKAKADIVVKLPLKPIPIIDTISELMTPILNIVTIIPSTKLPNTLTNNVPIGNPKPVGKRRTTKYRTNVPGIAPIMTKTILLENFEKTIRKTFDN